MKIKLHFSAVTSRGILAGGVLAVSAVGALWLFTTTAQADNKPATPPVLVSTALVKEQTVPLIRIGTGSVTAQQSVTVKARIDGQLEQIGFTEGQDVKAGQMLALLDARALQAQLEQAVAQKARDAAQLINAKADFNRYATLIGQDSATQQQFDTQRALVTQLEAAIMADDAQINYARVQLSYTRIIAPISGRTGARLVDVGNIVHASDPGGIVVINQVNPINVVFTLPENVYADVSKALKGARGGLSVTAHARGDEQPLANGKLVLMNNQIDSSSGTLQFKASFANPDYKLWPGQYVNVRLQLGQQSQALTIPAAAVQRSQSGIYAYVIDADNTARIQPVEVTLIRDGIAVIAKGLTVGQRVVTDGHYKLKPGAVIVESSTAKPGASASTAAKAAQ